VVFYSYLILMACYNRLDLDLDSEMVKIRGSKHLIVLFVLFILFLARVLSQFIQSVYPLDFLPDFASFQSGALSYEALLAFQLIIIAWCIYIINAIKKSAITPSKIKANLLLGFGLIYFSFMLFRLIAGFTFAAEGDWLNNPIPSTFHIVLSLFVLCHGHYHLHYANARS